MTGPLDPAAAAAAAAAEEEETEEEDWESAVEYGPQAQIVTNDLRSLDEMVSQSVFFFFFFFFSLFS